MAILEGYLIGLGMVIILGPVFFTLLQGTLENGRKAGLSIALGIFVSDLAAVLLCYIGAKDVFENEDYQIWIAIAGSIILFFLGIKYLVKPDMDTKQISKPSVLNLSAFFAKGFLVNFINPSVFLIWLATIAYSEGKYDTEINQEFFLLGVLFGILTTDSLKVLMAHRLKPLLNPKLLKKIYQIIGLILIIFGLRLLYVVWN